MADDEHGVRIAREEGLEPDRAFEVEIVGRLVEEQHVRPREEHRGERHPHPPAAGELGAGPRLRRRVEAEPVQDRGRPRLGRVRVDVGEAGVDLADAVRRRSPPRPRPSAPRARCRRRARCRSGCRGSPAPPAPRRRSARASAPRSRRRRAAARRGSAGRAWSCRCRCARRTRPCARPGSVAEASSKSFRPSIEKPMLRIASMAPMWPGARRCQPAGRRPRRERRHATGKPRASHAVHARGQRPRSHHCRLLFATRLLTCRRRLPPASG